MPYVKIADLPEAVKKLPQHAQEIWMAAFNWAFEQYEGDEEKCAGTAWAAVKNSYEKNERDEWGAVDKLGAGARIIGAGNRADPDYGYKWKVQIIEAGPDLQGGAVYPLEVLQAAMPLYENAKVFALPQGQHAHPDNPFGKSVRDIVGWLSAIQANHKGIEGTLNLLKTASWLRDMIVDAWERENKDLVR